MKLGKYLFIVFVVVLFCSLYTYKPLSGEVSKVVDVSDINITSYNDDLDIIKVNNLEFYVKSDRNFANNLVYATTINNFNTISSEVVLVGKHYYKYDIYKENKEIVLILLKFQDEDHGDEVVINLNRDKALAIVDKIREGQKSK